MIKRRVLDPWNIRFGVRFVLLLPVCQFDKLFHIQLFEILNVFGRIGIGVIAFVICVMDIRGRFFLCIDKAGSMYVSECIFRSIFWRCAQVWCVQVALINIVIFCILDRWWSTFPRNFGILLALTII